MSDKIRFRACGFVAPVGHTKVVTSNGGAQGVTWAFADDHDGTTKLFLTIHHADGSALAAQLDPAGLESLFRYGEAARAAAFPQHIPICG